MKRRSRLNALIILDGWGKGVPAEGNAVFRARMPYLDHLMAVYPHTDLQCAGEAVGLPEGVMGNSEVGHLNIGAGRIVYQDLLRINAAIGDGEFRKNDAFDTIMASVREKQSALHLMGLVSDGGVHSHLSHLLALLDLAKEKGLEKVFVHAILDGRDTPPESGAGFIAQLCDHLRGRDFGQIASICGRYYAMDRDHRWERTETAYRLYAQGRGSAAKEPVVAVRDAYGRGETDEFVRPIAMTDDDGRPLGVVGDGDGVLFFNFRADRARQLTRAFTESDFQPFDRETCPRLAGYLCMTQYDEKFSLPVAYPPVFLEQILGEVVSSQGLRQLRIAETEKYAHVTYFFNGGVETPFEGEERCLIPSPREIPTYDLKPEMSAELVTDEVISRIASRAYDLIVLNFANLDMVGHTGNLDAAVQACEAVDRCLERIVPEVLSQDGVAMITADHGNAERVREEGGALHTFHTTNPVPFVLVDDTGKDVVLREGVLGDIAPTILDVMGIEQPAEMTRTSLIT